MKKSKQFKGATKVSDAINDVVATLWENPDVGYSVYEGNSIVEITYDDNLEETLDEEVIEEDKTEDTSKESETLPETEGTVEEENNGEDVDGVESTEEQPSEVMESVVETRKGLYKSGIEGTAPDWNYAKTIEDSDTLVEYLAKFGFEGNPKNKAKTILSKAKKAFTE